MEAGMPKNILVVDDNEDVARIAAEIEAMAP